MLDNIKKRIAEQTKDVVAASRAADDDTMLVAEYAHLFQELSDLSIEGDGDSGAKIDILLTGDGKLSVDDDLDDVVLDEIGYNLQTGTLDVPADAAIKTEYAAMKSEDDFYTESTNLFQESDESNEEYEARCAQYADKNWKMYRQQVLQEGMFGYKRVNVTSEKVPSLATINFGNYNGSAYNVRMPIQHQVDKKGNLTRHQLESIYLAESCGLCENLMDEVKKDLCERYHISESASIWDTMIPSVLVAPVDPIDKHSIVVGFKNDANLAGMDFYRFTNPVCEYATGDTTLEHAAVERLDNAKVRELSKFCITRNAALKEAQKETPHFHRGFFQEAIDLGGDNQNANADNGDNNGVESTNSGSTDGGDNANANADGQQQNEAPKVEVGKNDVSDAIVQKAQDETTKNETPDDTTVEGQDAITDIDNAEVPSLDDGSTDDGVEGTDMNATPDGEATDADIDQQLNDLNASGEESEALDGNLTGDEIDIENMSIDEMLKMGTERLKGMSMSQLKEFLANNDAAAVQEAFILTNANINDEVDILLKKTLGVLNDNKMEIGQLVNEFKKYGKKLNKVLSKASKATKVYNNNEIDNIKKLNKCLTDLMITIKASTDKSSIQVIKRLMKAFTSQAAVVGKIVEKKKKELPEAKVKETKKKAVQESATMSSLLDIIAD
jgi:hypothetical protein